MQFELPVRVYYEDTDAGGVVYHAQYAAYMERARTDFLRALNLSQRDLREQFGVLFVVRAMQLDFHAPAVLDDALQVSAELSQLRKVQLVFTQQVRRAEQVLVAATVRVATVNASTFKPAAIPAAMIPILKGALRPCP